MNANTELIDACRAALELLINYVSSADPEIVAKDGGECFAAAEIEAAKVVVQLEAALVAAEGGAEPWPPTAALRVTIDP